MSQYQVGTVTVTNNSATVTGSGTAWAANAHVGDVFTIPGSNAWYEIGVVGSDTSITLTSVYAGTSGGGKNYVISTSFTPNVGIPYPEQQDVETASLFKRAMLYVEALITGRLQKSVAGNQNVTLTAAECRNRTLHFSGTLTGSINVIVVTKEREWVVYNNTSGAFTLTVKTASGTGIVVASGKRAILQCDTTNVVRVTADQ